MATKITSRVIAPGAVTAEALAPGVGAGPVIANVQIANSSYSVLDDTAVALEGGYILINGDNFGQNTQVIIANTNATSVTYISSSLVRAQVPAKSAGSYILYLVNTDTGATAIRVNAVTYSGTPTWVTGSTLTEGTVDTAISIQLNATSDSNVSYQLQNGSTLPSGLTLSANGLLSGTVTGLNVDTTYSFTIEATDAENQESPRTFSLTVRVIVSNFIATPEATPSIGASFQGGFFTGLIFNQVTQSATSTTIGTGSKTFTVTDAAPLFYSGQAIEVRSRANPATARMIGTVTASSGTTLVVNVTSVNGSGTFTDWSVMAKFRVIVSPKAAGESSKALKNVNSASPAACNTLTEGLKSTLAMVADGNSTVYPAAHFCNNLSIGGYSDWYLPARDELELIYRNLKPVTVDNLTGRSYLYNSFKNLGSLGDSDYSNGKNNNSSPQGVTYTAGSPGQTSVVAFQSGGAQAMRWGSGDYDIYWSSSEVLTSHNWVHFYRTFNPGLQSIGGKTNPYYARAVRRSII